MHRLCSSSLSDRLSALTLLRLCFFFFYLTVIDERVGKAATCFFFYPRVDSNLRPVPWQNPSLASGVCTSHSYSVTRLYSRTIILSVWNYCTVDAAKKSKNKSSSCGCGFFFFLVCFCMNVYILVQMCVDLLVLLNYYRKKKKTWQGIEPGSLSDRATSRGGFAFVHFWYGNSLVAVLVASAVDVYCRNDGPLNSWWCSFL